MIHLGDITKINGSAVEPVNVIIGGSPCQDLSIAGGRAGLAGERSGLFMEQIRLITEMRDADAARGRTGRSIRPRWMVWENVPGAFSSNKGADFAAVLHETIKIICPQAPAVSVPKHGWPTAGCLTDVGGKWSLAWRVFDAQFWGVPQRRKGGKPVRKHEKPQHRDKPWMCDPGMCDHCVYIGEGDFICDKGPGEPVIVVEDWVPNEDAGRCRRGR